MQKCVAFKSAPDDIDGVAKKLNDYIEEKRCRVVGFQLIRGPELEGEEYLLAIVEM